MSRNGSGTYSKAVSSFSSGGTITAADHNNLWDDISLEITNSVAADGQTPMTGPLKLPSGSLGAPALTFASDPDAGLYRPGGDSIAIVCSATAVQIWTTASSTFNVPVLFTSGVQISATATFTKGFLASSTCSFSDPVLMSGTATFTKGFLASNTCSFSHPILVSGTATFTKGFIASATCVFVDAILASSTATFTSGFIASASCSMGTLPLLSKNSAKAFGYVTYSGATPTLQAGSHNVTSITALGTGNLRVTFTTAMANTLFAAGGIAASGSNARICTESGRSTTTIEFTVYSTSNTAVDPSSISFWVLS